MFDRTAAARAGVDCKAQRIRELHACVFQNVRPVSVAAPSDSLGVAATTIRTDLRDLESGNFLLRTHGGAIEKPQTGFESNLRERAVENRAQKKQIAELALLQIENGDTILLDTGTTLRELARLLHQRTRLTVVTNDLAIVEGAGKRDRILGIVHHKHRDDAGFFDAGREF